MTSTSKFTIFAVSDSTGELAINVATAALRQFKQEEISILRRAKIRTPERILKVVREAKENQGFIIFTLVSPELRENLLRAAEEANVPAIDLMGPIMDRLTQYFQLIPSAKPGLQYQFTGEYSRRNEAVEFSVKHDDGQGLETIDQADIILLGISRTSKTPLSIYLAYRGFKTANIPIIREVPLPSLLRSVNLKKIVGLRISPEKLVDLRGARLAKLGLSRKEDYANIDFIRQELIYSEKVFEELGGCPAIDVTAKAIEEIASEVLTVLGL